MAKVLELIRTFKKNGSIVLHSDQQYMNFDCSLSWSVFGFVSFFHVYPSGEYVVTSHCTFHINVSDEY